MSMFLNLNYYKKLNICIHIIVAKGGIPKEPAILNLIKQVETQYSKKTYQIILLLLGKGSLIFNCTDSWENYFGSLGQQNNNTCNSFKFHTSKKRKY